MEINRGGGFGPFCAHFRTLNKISYFPIYLRVEINRGGGFGPFFCPFSYAKQKLQFSNTLVRGNKSGQHIWAFFCPFCMLNRNFNFSNTLAHGNCFWLPCSFLRLNSKILNLQIIILDTLLVKPVIKSEIKVNNQYMTLALFTFYHL